MPAPRSRRGSALLTVLWLSAALSAIAFSLANTVRGEAERAETSLDGVREYYLATGAIERALLWMEWQHLRSDEGKARFWTPETPAVTMPFPTGAATVEFIPEASKLNINYAPPEELFRLLLALGADAGRAREIALSIVDWRTPAPAGPPGIDLLAGGSTFPPRHASFEEIEELLLVRGMTPELYYGTYERDAAGRLAPRGGLRDCVTVYGVGGIDINTAQPAVMTAVGLPPEIAAAVVNMRRQQPFRDAQQMAAVLQGAPGAARLRIGGGMIYTLRATARLRLADSRYSDQRRSVAAVVRLWPKGYSDSYHLLRWYDNVWVQ